MNENLLKSVLENEGSLIPSIFTKKQFNALQRKALGKPLSNAERKTLSTSIKQKMRALESISQGRNIYITGHSNILPERLKAAELILKTYSSQGRVFIAGSFLFSKKFNDIDIFIITSRGYKEEWQGNHHLIFLSGSRLSSPVFQSAAQISISNFPIKSAFEKNRPKLENLMSDYHEAVIEKIRDDEKKEAIRRLAFAHLLFVKDNIPNAKQLKEKTTGASLSELDQMMKELCATLFSRQYLYIGLHTYIKTLEESIKNIKLNSHLQRYKNAYEELIYGKQRSKAETA